jgi:AAA domain
MRKVDSDQWFRENPDPEWDKFMYDDMKRGAGGESRRTIPLVAFNEVTLGKRRRYLVKGVIPRVGLTVAWGPPKCGKSFWTFDTMMHIALGRPYRGRCIEQGPVIYCAFEGQIGMEARIEAYRQRCMADHHGKVPFYLMPVTLDLVRDHKALIAAIKDKLGVEKPVAVALDTLNRSLRGSENDEHMAAYVNAADAIRAAFDCAIVIVHHCGIDGTRPRGHTSLPGAVDAQLAVTRDADDNVVVTVEYMKDGPDAGTTILSRLEAVEVGIDEDGEPITSCVVVPIDGGKPTRATKTAKLSPIPRAALRHLHECLAERGRPATDNDHVPAEAKTVTSTEWKDQLLKASIINRDGNPREQFRRIHVTLSNAGLIGIWNDIVWAVT